MKLFSSILAHFARITGRADITTLETEAELDEALEKVPQMVDVSEVTKMKDSLADLSGVMASIKAESEAGKTDVAAKIDAIQTSINALAGKTDQLTANLQQLATGFLDLKIKTPTGGNDPNAGGNLEPPVNKEGNPNVVSVKVDTSIPKPKFHIPS